LALTGEYSQTFDRDDICQCLFGGQTVNSNTLATRDAAKLTGAASSNNACSSDCDDCDDCCIVVSGSCVDAGKRDANDWVADYFGLPTDYQSTICFAPRIRNFVADVQGYFGFNHDCAQNFYARFNMPITWTEWNLNYTEKIIEEGTRDHQKGYFDASYVARVDLVKQATDFFTGRSVPALATATFEALACSKWAPACDSCFDRKKVKVADVEGVLGWNFACDDECYIGLNVRATAPTGTRPKGEFLFEPIIGNGKHWELGGGLTSHAQLWHCDHSDAALNFYLDANITHLFKACQTRCFDLTGRPNSRYWLALKLGANKDGLAGGSGETPELSDFQFASAFAPVANLTCVKVNVRANVQADIALKFAYTTGCGFGADLGYNFWMRSCDKIKRCRLTRLETENWALKGTAYVYGFETFPTSNADQGTPVALAPSASAPTIACGDSANTLSNIDNPQTAVFIAPSESATIISANCLANAQCVGASDSGNVNTSIQPKLLSASDIDFVGSKGMSHKIFAHLDYNWKNGKNYIPFVGVGGSGEFGQENGCDERCDESVDAACSFMQSCDSDNIARDCVRCAISQWSVWIKGGVAFN